MGRAGVAGAGVVLLGVAGMAAAVLADLGRWPYYGGAALLVLGLGLLLSRLLHHRWALVATCATIALVVAGGAWLGLDNVPEQHAAWPQRSGGYGITGDAARQGDLWFTGAAAHEIATGEVRWTAWDEDEDPSTAEHMDLVAVTPESVVSIEPARNRSSGRLVARSPADGREKWSVPTMLGRGAAVDGNVLVITTSKGTRAHDLRTGKTMWTMPQASAAACELGDLRNSFGPARPQGVVLLSSEARGATASAVRVSDGKVIATDLSCLQGIRVVDDVVLHADRNRLVGRSGDDGSVLWRTPQDQDLPHSYSVSGSGSQVYTPGRYEFSDGTEAIRSYFGIDVDTGEITETSPPDGWLVVRDETRRQVGEHVWQPVTREEGGSGLWEVGTDRVVTVPGLRIHRSMESDPTSGWLVLTGLVADPVGGERAHTWALSPDGDLHGPYRGRSVSIGDGLVAVDGTVHPVD